MNDRTPVRRWPRQARPSPARTAAIIATAASGLLAAACASSPSSTSSSAPAAQQNGLLAFSRCMRSHAVPNFPDPNRSGVLPKSQITQLAASSPLFPAAHRACEQLLPNGGQPTQAQAQQAWNDMRNFARCMRSHGVPNRPDPAATSQQDQRPSFTCRTALTRTRRRSPPRSTHASTCSTRITRS
jgi:hypothetical protein